MSGWLLFYSDVLKSQYVVVYASRIDILPEIVCGRVE